MCGTALTAATAATATPVVQVEPARLTTADLDHLRAYLPPSLIEALQFAPTSPPPGLLEQCIGHLTAVLETIYTHLPLYLVEWLMHDPTPGRIGGQFMDGTLLFADISGFTAMSEQLSRMGREGAEEINTIVNRYFATMLSILREHQGQLVEFGGDALLGLFLEPESATRGVQAAQSMRAAMGAFAQTQTSQGVFDVQMKVGIHKGRFFAAQLGTPRHMQYALFGADVSATAATESAASAGQILIDQATKRAITLPCKTVPASQSSYLLVEEIEPATLSAYLPEPPRPRFSEPTLDSLRHAVKLLDVTTPYVPSGLVARLASAPHDASLQGEHRLVAVLFATVLGLGQITDRLGPGREEEIVSALNQYLVAMEREIQRFGGVINTIDLNDHGDKLFTSFGAPLAHEDDAERAVRAALAMQEKLAEFSRSLPAEAGLPDLQLSQSIGISFGYVFAGYVGTSWRHDYTVMGDDTNLAARLTARAEPGTVVVSGDVRRKVQTIFDLTSRGEVTLKGKSEPITIYSVDGLRTLPDPTRGLSEIQSPLVGRQAELDQLKTALDKLLVGQGQIVCVIGEAGLGKSRLVAEIPEEKRSARWVEGRCLSYTETASYWPIQELIQRLVGVQADDSGRVAWAKLLDTLERRLDPEERTMVLPYLGNFLNLPLEDDLLEQVRYLDAEALQRRTFVALSTLIERYATAESTPLVLLLEDIHWLDQASLTFLEHVMSLVNRVPLMLLLVYRPERAKACWQIHEKAAREFAHCTTQITLRPLAADSSQQLLSNLAGIDRWPPAVRELILSRTEGNPLYLEEVLRALIEDGVMVRAEEGQWQIAGDFSSFKVPDTLQGVMMARLDRMEEPHRWTARIASVMGRVFPFDVLTYVQEADGGQINQHLTALQQHEIVQETQRVPELVYTFKHAMMQEVCYRSLLTRTRHQYHRRVAEYLESRQPSGGREAEGNYAVIAHHAFAGQDWPRALHYQLLAGQQAQRLFANQDAIGHFEKALQSAENLDQGETAVHRQTIHTALGELLTVTSQYDEALEHLNQALSLATASGDEEGQARVCQWLARLHERRGEYASTLEWVQQGLDALQGQETPEAAELLLVAGLIHTRQGNYDDALEQCQKGLGIAQGLNELSALARGYNLLGHVTRLLGMSPMAIEHFEQAFELHQRTGDLHGQATSRNQIANACFGVGRWQEAEQHYREAREIFDRMGDVYNCAFVDNNLGGIALNQGRLDEALAFYQEGLQTLERIGGSSYVLGVFQMNLGATFIRQGEIETARQHLSAGQEYFEQAQVRDFLPEMHRYFAEAALQANELAEAEAQGQKALGLAQELSMRGEEGMSLRVLGEIDVAQGQLDQAESHLSESVSLLEEVADEYEGARSQLSLAKVYASQEKREAVLSLLEQCVATFERLDAKLDSGDAHALRDSIA
jgi:class 3 adenylate cyclase/predicted ATPase